MEIRIKLNTVKNAMLFATVCDNYEEDIDYICGRYQIDVNQFLGLWELDSKENAQLCSTRKMSM